MATRIAVMDEGVIQQFGTPDEIYETPANLFVAGFIGSPAINIFSATLTAKGTTTGGIEADLSGYPFSTPPTDGQAVTIGLRPEHFRIGEGGGAVRLTLPVRHTERTGSDATAFLDNGGQLVAVRIDPGMLARLKPGDTVTATYPAEKINLFDAMNGRKL